MRTKRINWPGHATVDEAVQYLASVCDGSIKRDGHGFCSDHVAYGHWLAQLPPAEWGPEEHRHARSIVCVYREQLRRAGFDPEQILGKRRPSRVTRRQVERLQTGWAPDPTGHAAMRWWNGARWTAIVNTSDSLSGTQIV